jgi:hypothetical protein
VPRFVTLAQRDGLAQSQFAFVNPGERDWSSARAWLRSEASNE